MNIVLILLRRSYPYDRRLTNIERFENKAGVNHQDNYLHMHPQEKPKKTLTYAQKVKAGIIKQKPRQAMKRSPAPVSTKPRKRLRQVSKSKTAKMATYHKWVKCAFIGIEICQRCGCRDEGLEPHHPSGRGGPHLFEVVAVCSSCHRWIHENANKAFDEGWLQPPIRGLAPDPKHPKPFETVQFFDKRYDATVKGKTVCETDDLSEARASIATLLDKSHLGTTDHGEIEVWAIWDNLKMEEVASSGDLKKLHEDEREMLVTTEWFCPNCGQMEESELHRDTHECQED